MVTDENQDVGTPPDFHIVFAYFFCPSHIIRWWYWLLNYVEISVLHILYQVEPY